MRAIFVAPVAILGVAAITGPADATARPSGLDGRLTCTAGQECVYTLRNDGSQTSYVSYASRQFGWGSAHFAGGGCLRPGESLRQVSFTHNGHGIEVVPGTSVSQPFDLPYMPGDNRC